MNVDRWRDGWIDGWEDGWIDGYMNAWVNEGKERKKKGTKQPQTDGVCSSCPFLSNFPSTILKHSSTATVPS
jgi:hypothetical protein